MPPRNAQAPGANRGKRGRERNATTAHSTLTGAERSITRESNNPVRAWRDVARHIADHDLRHWRARANYVLIFAEFESPFPDHDRVIVGWQIEAIDAELAARERRASIRTGTAAGFSEAFIADLKEHLPLNDLIENGGDALRKAGKVYRGNSPFHESKSRASLTVSPDNGLWRCHGCGKGGDHYTWLTERWGLDFPKAVTALAAMTGVELPQPPRLVRVPKRRAVRDA